MCEVDMAKIKAVLDSILEDERPSFVRYAEGVGSDRNDRGVVSMIEYAEGVFYETISAKFVAAFEAKKRIAKGIYGDCTGCGERIAPERLNAVPWTPFCNECQEGIEESKRIADHRKNRRNSYRLGAVA